MTIHENKTINFDYLINLYSRAQNQCQQLFGVRLDVKFITNDKQGGGGSDPNIFEGTIQAWARDNLGHHEVLKTLAH
jgi:hypothetical protein